MCVLPRWLASSAQFVVEPPKQVPEGLWTGDDVERRRESAALVKVTHPQFGAGKLPLDVGMVLEDDKQTVFFILNLFYLDQFFTFMICNVRAFHYQIITHNQFILETIKLVSS